MAWHTWSAVLLMVASGVRGEAQTLPLPTGSGFVWERVGEAAFNIPEDLVFDAGGTLWNSFEVRWLDARSGFPGVWIQPAFRAGSAILTLGPHPAGGLPRADTVLAAGGNVSRSTNGGATWTTVETNARGVLYLIPAGHAFSGRILVGETGARSDDRGATWTRTTSEPVMEFYDFISLPPADLLPGSRSGRAVAAPPDWPAGRIIATGAQGVQMSDDGGDVYVPTSYFAFSNHVQQVELIRRPDGHPLGPGPRLVALRNGAPTGVATYTSDDGGATWQRGVDLSEPPDGGVRWGLGQGLHALSERGETDPGAGGRALAVLGRGHLYQTTDGAETWTVVGRAPEMLADPANSEYGSVNSTEIGPDGRLYVGGSRLGGANPGWAFRTVAPVVAVEPPPDSAPGSMPGIALTVRPNPAGGRVEVVLELAEASDVHVVILDALGREVAVVLDGAAPHGEHVVGMDTASWPAGVYVVRATAAGSGGAQTATARLVVAQ